MTVVPPGLVSTVKVTNVKPTRKKTSSSRCDVETVLGRWTRFAVFVGSGRRYNLPLRNINFISDSS